MFKFFPSFLSFSLFFFLPLGATASARFRVDSAARRSRIFYEQYVAHRVLTRCGMRCAFIPLGCHFIPRPCRQPRKSAKNIGRRLDGKSRPIEEGRGTRCPSCYCSEKLRAWSEGGKRGRVDLQTHDHNVDRHSFARDAYIYREYIDIAIANIGAIRRTLLFETPFRRFLLVLAPIANLIISSDTGDLALPSDCARSY